MVHLVTSIELCLLMLLQVDFSGGKTGHRAKQQQGKTEQVVKAAALPKRRAPASVSAITGATTDHRPPSPSGQPSSSSSPTSDSSRDASDTLPLLWDLTAGLGTDAFLLAQAGWRVQMFERSPVVAAMVEVRRKRMCYFQGPKCRFGGTA